MHGALFISAAIRQEIEGDETSLVFMESNTCTKHQQICFI